MKNWAPFAIFTAGFNNAFQKMFSRILWVCDANFCKGQIYIIFPKLCEPHIINIKYIAFHCYCFFFFKNLKDDSIIKTVTVN